MTLDTAGWIVAAALYLLGALLIAGIAGQERGGELSRRERMICMLIGWLWPAWAVAGVAIGVGRAWRKR